MALHGLDRAAAPPAAKAKAMLEQIHGTWWNVYIGGPRSAGSGWTSDRVRDYVANGITRFLLTYVGRQVIPRRHIDDSRLLTASQGRDDGDEACRIAAGFGYGAGTPICLDLELSTFEASRPKSMNYVGGWCQSVRARGLRPGVYCNIPAVIALGARDDRPDWVWVAKWVKHKVDAKSDPHRIPDLAHDLFPKVGQRAWQYAGAFDDVPLRVSGLDVDISVADSDCLARVPAASAVALMEEELTIVDADTKKYFEAKFKQTNDLATGLFRVTDHGNEDAGRANHHKVIRDEVKDLRTEVHKELGDLRKMLEQVTKTLDRIAPPRRSRSGRSSND